MTMGRIGLIGLIVLGLCMPAWGALTRKVQYVDPTAAGTNDGSSWTNAFSTWAAAEAQNTNLVAADQYCQIYMRGGVEELTTAIVIAGWGTDATHTLSFIQDPNNYHDGVYKLTGAYRAHWNSADAGQVVTINQAYCIVDGVEFEGRRTSSWNYNLITVGDYAGIVVRNCLSKRCVPTGNYAGIFIADGAAEGRYVYNNIIWNCRVGISVYGSWVNGGAFNNTIADSLAYGIWIQSGAGATVSGIKNNLITGSGTADYIEAYPSASHVKANNYVSDTSLPDGQEAYESHAFAFVDADANDFHLASTEYYKYNASDPGITGLTADIDGQTRDKWHAGADEVMKPGGRLIGRASVIQQILRRKRQ